MLDDILWILAIFLAAMVLFGIYLTIQEFKKHVMDEQRIPPEFVPRPPHHQHRHHHHHRNRHHHNPRRNFHAGE